MLRANHRVEGNCYTSVGSRRHIAFHMLGYAYRVFLPTSRIKRISEIAAQFDRRRKGDNLAVSSDLWQSLDPVVVDAFRIATAFENAFKARLLLNGWVIHKVDRNRDNALFKEQRSRPIRLSRIKTLEGLAGQRDIGYEFQTLTKHTLDWSTLVEQEKYRQALRVPDRLLAALRPFAATRNTLHFLALQASTYSKRETDELRRIQRGFNTYIVGQHNRLASQLGLPANWILAKI